MNAPAKKKNAIPDWVERMNARYALVERGGKLTVADFEAPIETARGVTTGLNFTSLQAFKARYVSDFAPPATPDGKPTPLGDAWAKHRARRHYVAAVFTPGQDVPDGVLNLWQGFAVEPAPGDVAPWLRVLDAVVTDPATRDYTLKWLARKVQRPGDVPGTVLVLTGAKGVGKNSLFAPLLEVFGRHAILVDNPALIAGQFTGHMQDKALAVLDEAVFTGDPRQADAIKARVTARETVFEAKGVDPVTGFNRCAYVMFTNHEHAWQATTDERRAVMIEAGEALRGDHAAWREYHAWQAGGGAAHLLHYLLHDVDLTGFSPQAIPKGAALRKQVELTALRDPVKAWWHGVLDAGQITYQGEGRQVIPLHEDDSTEVPRHALEASYSQRAGSRNGAPAFSGAKKKLHEWNGKQPFPQSHPTIGMGKRERVDHLPPLWELRRRFTEATGLGFD